MEYIDSIFLDDVEKFKNREVKAKDIFEIKEIDKSVAYEFVKHYHYLKDAKFFSKFAYGMFYKNMLVGCATYSNPQGVHALYGWFSLPNSDQSVLELSRLCMLPLLNGTNATSFLLGNSLKMLKKHNIRAVITLADASRHIGSIYQVCNFKYYGLSDFKKELVRYPDAKVNPRDKNIVIKDTIGVWMPKTRKLRYAYIFDKTLKCNFKSLPYPKKGETIDKNCCNGTKVVFDNRFKQYYTCPYCCGKMLKLDGEFNVQEELSEDMLNIQSINLKRYVNNN